MTNSNFILFTLLSVFFSIQLQANEKEISDAIEASTMTNERLNKIILNLDDQVEGGNGFWKFKISNLSISVITDEKKDRMRIIIPIVKANNIGKDQLYRFMQANFDSTLDARYAIAKNVLWSAYIHPLASLTDEEFLIGLGQTVNLVTNYGGSYSSGYLTFQGGDSKSLLDKQLIEELIEKGSAI